MTKKTRKAQVVIAGYDAKSQSVFYLLMQVNKKRGSFWQNVTGKVDEGESYEEGALREAHEETGLRPEHIVNVIDLELSHDFIDWRNRDSHEKSFFVIVDRTFKVKISPEHQSYRWEKSPTREMVKHLGNFEALDRAIKVLKKDFT